MNTYVYAFAESVTPTSRTRLVKVRCPFCAELHFHGWPFGDRTTLVRNEGRTVRGVRSIGHRASDCRFLSTPGYVVLVNARDVLGIVGGRHG